MGANSSVLYFRDCGRGGVAVKVLDLFSGIGGFSLGLERAGMETVAFCEYDEKCRQVLKKHWPDVPQYTDVRTLTAEQLEHDGITIDGMCGGFPCQDLSFAGHGEGLAGERSGLWFEYKRLIGELRPRFALIENVTAILVRGLDRLLCDLAALGYSAQWHCIPASYLGAAHNRDRFWLIAYPNGSKLASLDLSKSFLAYQKKPCRREHSRAIDACLPANDYIEMRGDFDDVPGEMERLKQYGNAVVPQVVEVIGKAIMESA